MGRARFCIQPEFLCEILNLPPGTKVFGAMWHFDVQNGALELYVEHPELPEHMPGQPITQASPQLRSQPPIVFDGWGLPEQEKKQEKQPEPQSNCKPASQQHFFGRGI